MTESRNLASSSRKSPEFGSPRESRDIKFVKSELKTNYKNPTEETPYKGVFGKSQYQKESTTKKNSRSEHKKRSYSTDKKNVQSDLELDNIEKEIEKIGNRLKDIHFQTIGKQPSQLEDQRRDLRKQLIDLDYNHKMICAKKQIYGKEGPLNLIDTSSSLDIRLAEIQTELALSRSRRLRDLQTDIVLSEWQLDWPCSSFYELRPWRYSGYLNSYYCYPSYSSLWWL